MRIHTIKSLRRLVLPVLRRMDADISIRHHWTKERLKLHLFKHKGYWYHGRNREAATMQLFTDLVGPGDFVVEIGGHIGYVTMHLASLVSPGGQVVVFEPAPDNLRYIRLNTRDNPAVLVVEQAVTDHNGSASLYVEELTGQNNSLLPHYDVLDQNQQRAYSDSGKHVVEVDCTSLDEYLARATPSLPSLVKIDVEGAEYSVLKGMRSSLQGADVALMVEVTESAADVYALLTEAGFKVFYPDRTPVTNPGDARGNLFCLKDTDHRIMHFRSF